MKLNEVTQVVESTQEANEAMKGFNWTPILDRWKVKPADRPNVTKALQAAYRYGFNARNK